MLGAWKLPTACAEAILPHLRGVVQDFGVPCAVVRDLGWAITEADADLGGRESDRAPPALAKSLTETQRAFRTFVRDFRHHRATPHLPSEERAMLDVVPSHLDRPAATLGGHVVAGPQPGMIRVVPRTSNLLEQFLHRLKHGERRRAGRKVLPTTSKPSRRVPLWRATSATPITSPWSVGALTISLRDSAPSPPRPAARPSQTRPPELTRAALPVGARRLVRRPAFRQRLLAAC